MTEHALPGHSMYETCDITCWRSACWGWLASSQQVSTRLSPPVPRAYQTPSGTLRTWRVWWSCHAGSLCTPSRTVRLRLVSSEWVSERASEGRMPLLTRHAIHRCLTWGGRLQTVHAQGVCQHENFDCQGCGLVLSSDYPMFGASPDGLVECKYCGLGCLEIKCLFILKHGDLCGVMSDSCHWGLSGRPSQHVLLPDLFKCKCLWLADTTLIVWCGCRVRFLWNGSMSMRRSGRTRLMLLRVFMRSVWFQNYMINISQRNACWWITMVPTKVPLMFNIIHSYAEVLMTGADLLWQWLLWHTVVSCKMS